MKEWSLRILQQSFGAYQTHCYILDLPQGQFIIDPGENAHQWVITHCPKPIAILNTHGHFDHIWDNAKLQEHFEGIPLICHELDAFLLQSDVFSLGLTPSHPTTLIQSHNTSQTLTLEGVEVKFHHFPGHTPGCCMIEIAGQIFSGDFIFYRSIGRSDFAYSSPKDMRESLLRFESLQEIADMPLYPGHGERTIARDEQANVKFWLPRIENA